MATEPDSGLEPTSEGPVDEAAPIYERVISEESVESEPSAEAEAEPVLSADTADVTPAPVSESVSSEEELELTPEQVAVEEERESERPTALEPTEPEQTAFSKVSSESVGAWDKIGEWSQESDEAIAHRFQVQPLTLPEPVLDAQWFEENPVPAASECREPALRALAVKLWEVARLSPLLDRATLALYELSVVAHELLGLPEFAQRCAAQVRESNPELKSARLIEERAAVQRGAFKSLSADVDDEWRHGLGHRALAEGESASAQAVWRSSASLSPPLYLSLAAFFEAHKRRDLDQLLEQLEALLLAVEDPNLKALLISERLRFIAEGRDANALRSAIYRAVEESDRHATTNLLARMEQEALQSQDSALLIESLRLRLGLESLEPSALQEHQLEDRSRDRGFLFYRLAGLLEEADAQEAARAAYHTAARCLPHEPTLLNKLFSLAITLGDFQEARSLLRQRAVRADRAEEAANLWYQRGLLALQELEDRDAARADFKQAVQLCPTFSSALAALGRMAFDENRPEALQRHYSDEIEALERLLQGLENSLSGADQEATQAYIESTLVRRSYQFGRLLQQVMGENEVALTYHQKALAIDPDFSPSLLALEEIYEAQGRWGRLVKLYEHRLQELEAQEASAEQLGALRLSIADLYHTYLHEPLQANRFYTKVATFEGAESFYALRQASETFWRIGEYQNSILIENRRAKLYREATENDEGCLLQAAVLQELVGDLKGNSSLALPIYQRAWQGAQQPLAFDGLWRSALLSEQSDALNYYLSPRGLCLLGSEGLIICAAEALLATGHSGRSARLFALWSDRLEGPIPANCTRFANWIELETKVGEVDEVLDLSWQHFHERSEAEAHISTMIQRGEWESANQALLHLAQLAGPSEEAFLWYRIAFNLERGPRDLIEARRAYRRALSLDPACLPALAALRRISWVAGDHQSYLDVTRTLTDLEQNPLVQEAFRTHLGDFVLHVLKEEAEALQHYRSALDAFLSPERSAHQKSFMPLAQRKRYTLMSRRGEWPELVNELEGLSDCLTEASERIRLDWLAVLYEVHLAEPERAHSLNERLLALDPENVRARRAVRRSLAQQEDRDEYLRFLKRSLDRESHAPLEELTILCQIAECYEVLGDERSAERFWRKTLRLSPDFLPGYQGVGRAVQRRGRWSELVTLYRKELQALDAGSPARIDVLRRLAELYDLRVDRPEIAANCHEEILEILPDDPIALAALDRIYRRIGQRRPLARVWLNNASLRRTPAEQALAFLTAGELFLKEPFTEDDALDAFENAHRLAPELLPVSWALERLLLARGRRGRVVDLYREMLRHLTLPRERQLLAQKLMAELSSHQISKALDADLRGEADSLELLWWRILHALERPKPLRIAQLMLRFAQQLQDPRDRYAFALEAGQQASMGRPLMARAQPIWEQVLALEPKSRSAWAILLEQARQRELKDGVAPFRTLLARLRWATDSREERALCLGLQGYLEQREGGAPLAWSLYETANEESPRGLFAPFLLSAALPRYEAERCAEQQLELAARLPEGPLKGDALYRAAQIWSEDLERGRDAVELFLEAARNHHPDGARSAARVYQQNRGASLQPAPLAPEQGEDESEGYRDPGAFDPDRAEDDEGEG
ncbi:MAG: hypothetical protein VYD19_10000 [Myxococcota bacterium]|nr:hypothetical protein [Myxococcota bacterium]